MAGHRLRDYTLSHAPTDGLHSTLLPRVKVYRASNVTACQPCLYDPAIIFVTQGSKRCYLNGDSFQFGDHNYFVVTVPLPLESEILQASEEAPFLAAALTIDMAELGDLIISLYDGEERAVSTQRGAYTASLSHRHEDALLRLFQALENEQDARILGPQICREVLYLALVGENGDSLFAMARMHGASTRIARVLKVIHENPQQALDVPQMAAMAQMSKSAFFAAFKDVTSMSPVQYQKSIRLHMARNLILNEGLLVSDAAYRVGYSTASQFSRDYARFFEKTARQDLAETTGGVIAFS